MLCLLRTNWVKMKADESKVGEVSKTITLNSRIIWFLIEKDI